jgi:hypothetical protein
MSLKNPVTKDKSFIASNQFHNTYSWLASTFAACNPLKDATGT